MSEGSLRSCPILGNPVNCGLPGFSVREGDSQGMNTGVYWPIMVSISFFNSVAQSCPTLCNPMEHSMPGLPDHHQLLKLIQTHVHWVGDAIQPSRLLSSPSPPAFNLSQNQDSFPMSRLFTSGGQSINHSFFAYSKGFFPFPLKSKKYTRVSLRWGPLGLGVDTCRYPVYSLDRHLKHGNSTSIKIII